MKALQTRSPIHLFYQYTDLTRVNVSIYLDKNPNNFDTDTTPRYNLQSESINNESIFEISDLLRSANQYEFEVDFYDKRDTAIYVLCKADLYDSNDSLIEVRHNFLRVRDGYVERQEQSQILNNILPSDVRNWTDNFSNIVINTNQNDPFGGSNAYLVADGANDSLPAGIEFVGSFIGIYTFTVWLKKETNTSMLVEVNDNFIIFDFDPFQITNTENIGFDFFIIGDWLKLSVLLNQQIQQTEIRIVSNNNLQNEEFYVFNPTLIKGNHINANATDLVLQDNLKGYSTNNITNQFLVDKKLSNAYNHGLPFFDIKQYFANNPEVQSAIIPQNNSDLQFTDLANEQTEADIQNIVLYECKYQPVKVTFLNRFGVLQDLVFFKKRVDSSSTDSESYKANLITSGEVYKHLGQRRVYNKQAEAKVKLSSGFYPESFNTVFKQLIFSEMVFINDEPAVISTSTFRQKTQIDDKLINYDIDFDFANDDINSIR